MKKTNSEKIKILRKKLTCIESTIRGIIIQIGKINTLRKEVICMGPFGSYDLLTKAYLETRIDLDLEMTKEEKKFLKTDEAKSILDEVSKVRHRCFKQACIETLGEDPDEW